jgi:hypothetical protein
VYGSERHKFLDYVLDHFSDAEFLQEFGMARCVEDHARGMEGDRTRKC